MFFVTFEALTSMQKFLCGSSKAFGMVLQGLISQIIIVNLCGGRGPDKKQEAANSRHTPDPEVENQRRELVEMADADLESWRWRFSLAILGLEYLYP